MNSNQQTRRKAWFLVCHPIPTPLFHGSHLFILLFLSNRFHPSNSTGLFKPRAFTRAEYVELQERRYSPLQRTYFAECARIAAAASASGDGSAASPSPATATAAPGAGNAFAPAPVVPAGAGSTSGGSGSSTAGAGALQAQCLDTQGAINLTVSFPESGLPARVVRVDRQATTTDLLFVCLREFGRRLADADPRLFHLRATTRASSVAGAFYRGSDPLPGIAPDTALLPRGGQGQRQSFVLWPLAPLWLYSLASGDAVELVRVQGADTPPAERGSSRVSALALMPPGYTTVKLVLEEVHAAATVMLPMMMRLDAVVRAANLFDWGLLDIHYAPVLDANLRYYALFRLSPGDCSRWVELPGAETLAQQRLPELSVLLLKRRPVFELEYQCTIGPRAAQFSLDALQRRTRGQHEGDSGAGAGDGTDADELPPHKIMIPFGTAVTDAERMIMLWMRNTFGADLLEHSESPSPQPSTSPAPAPAAPVSTTTTPEARADCGNSEKAVESPEAKKEESGKDGDESDESENEEEEKEDGKNEEGNGDETSDDEENVEVKLPPKVVQKKLSVDDPDDEASTPSQSSESLLVEDSNSSTGEGSAATSTATSPEVKAIRVHRNSDCSGEPTLLLTEEARPRHQSAAAAPAAAPTAVPTTTAEKTTKSVVVAPSGVVATSKVGEGFSEAVAAAFTCSGRGGPRIFSHMRRNGKLISTATLDETTVVAGDFVEVRYGSTAAQFVVSYTPQFALDRQGADRGSAVDYDGEMVVQKVRDAGHMYLPWLGTEEVIVPGSLTVTNYKLVFESDRETRKYDFRLPLGAIRSVAKSNVGDLVRVALACKDMHAVTLVFPDRAQRREFVQRVSAAAFVAPALERLFAFAYRSPFAQNGWHVFSMEKEYHRLGLLDSACGWRITRANSDYALCATYPAVLGVPAAAPDRMVHAESRARSQQRFPVLTWRAPDGGMTITRAAQPSVGLMGSHSKTDQQYLALVRQTNTANPDVLYILDSRPKANAIGNRTRGGGYEDTSGSVYPGCKLEFEDIPNIHVVRESYNRLKALCQTTTDESTFLSELDASRWFDMTSTILRSVLKTVLLVARRKASVVLHCSDGWDRTSQCCALAELCLDPYYRTVVGFEVLVEKDWLAFGHKFEQRYALGSGRPSDQQSPIFPQFIFCVYQLLEQFPRSFQFNERFLLAILAHLYSNRFGTFLCNSERERRALALRERTVSLWSYINSDIDQFLNPMFALQNSARVLVPDPSLRAIRFWHRYFMSWFYKLEVDCVFSAARVSYTPFDDIEAWRAKYYAAQQQLDDLQHQNQELRRKLAQLQGSTSEGGSSDGATGGAIGGSSAPTSDAPSPAPSTPSVSPGNHPNNRRLHQACHFK